MMRKIAKAEDPVQLFYNSDLTKTMVEEFQTNGWLMMKWAKIVNASRMF